MNLPFVSIDTWTIIMQWGNLIVLMIILKKLLFDRVMKVLNERDREINEMYSKADTAQKNAEALKAEYSGKIAEAKTEADEIMKAAVKKANANSEEILNEAQLRVNSMMASADEKIKAERKKVMSGARDELSDMAVTLAGKIIEKDINAADHSRMIEDFIEELGDVS